MVTQNAHEFLGIVAHSTNRSVRTHSGSGCRPSHLEWLLAVMLLPPSCQCAVSVALVRGLVHQGISEETTRSA